MQVEIKERKLTAGNRSLYLEYYETGFRKRENLRLYLVPDDAPNAKQLNAQTYSIAREIRAQRVLCPPTFGAKGMQPKEEEREPITWLQWADRYVEWSAECDNCKKMLQHKDIVRKRIRAFLKRRKMLDLLLADVDGEVVGGLFDYMRRYRNKRQIKTDGGRLADYTLWLFEETIKAMFNKAVREDLISHNPVQELSKLQRFRAPDKHREFLTADELRRFLAADTATLAEHTVQVAFGFACMTAFRLGDMQRLRWSDIKGVGGVRTVSIIQHKTKRPVTVPLNDIALSLLPTRPEGAAADGIIFPLPRKSDNVSKYVRRIRDRAGIEKDFTFHSSRHTAATLAITAGAELYTVGKILGHGSIVSTQVYASVNMEKKVEAVSLTAGIFG